MAGRPKGTVKTKRAKISDCNDPTKSSQTISTPICLRCGINGKPNSFHMTHNPMYFYNMGKLPYCKECINEMFEELCKKYGDTKLAIYYFCRKIDLFYDEKLFDGALKKSLSQNIPLALSYIIIYNSFKLNSGYGSSFGESSSFLDIDILERKYREGAVTINGNVIENPEVEKDEDVASRKDCINMLGYDPFTSYNTIERKFLFNSLVRFLDDATLEDPFKRLIVIEIVKTLGQIEKLNVAFTSMMASSDNIEDNAHKISTLVASKEKLYTSCLRLAKDNGISVSYNTKKSKGAGTLSGVVKELGEIGLRDAKVNLYDIRTSEAMKQVADISNKSIIDQINLQESELWEMIKELREVRVSRESKIAELEENLRLEKVKNKDNETIISQMEEYITKQKEEYDKLNSSKYQRA